MLLREYLQKKYGISRRKFTDFVDQGQVFLNNQKVESYKQEIHNGEQLVIDGLKHKVSEKVQLKEENPESTMILFNKPKWYVVSKSDSHNTTIYTILPQKFQNYYYIGRLDKDSRGLLLLTNDPKLVHQWEHPKFEVEKEYVVEIDKPLDEKDKDKMLVWVQDEDDTLRVSMVQIKKPTLVNITLREGKKRHIRRIFRALWYRVWDLQRVREGSFKLENLKEGEWKIL